MRPLAFGIGVALLVLVGGAAAGSVTWIFWEAWRGADRDAFRALLGAFCGAFFAFLFVRFGDGLKRIFERQEKNHTSLVRLQHYFNECLNVTADDEFVCTDYLGIFTEERLGKGQLPIFMNQFQSYEIDRDVLLGLTNLEYLNEVFTINVELRKLNDSMQATDRAYGQMREAFVAGKIDSTAYLANVLSSRKRYAELKEFLAEAQKDLVSALAKSNILLRDAPFLTRVVGKLAKSKYPRGFEDKLKQEIARVSADIEKGAEISQARINEVNDRVVQESTTGGAGEA